MKKLPKIGDTVKCLKITDDGILFNEMQNLQKYIGMIGVVSEVWFESEIGNEGESYYVSFDFEDHEESLELLPHELEILY